MDRATLYYGEAVRQTTEQEETRRHFDGMAVQTLGFSAVSFSLLLLNKWQFSIVQLCIFIICLLLFLGTAISSILSLRLRRWKFSPTLPTLYKHMESLEYEEEALNLWVGKYLSESIDTNDKQMERKARYLLSAYILLGLEEMAIGFLIISCFF